MQNALAGLLNREKFDVEEERMESAVQDFSSSGWCEDWINVVL